ncbi:hypothetical protein [Yersinia artesiana]|uniref:hypothetical protein n=1 Tax=Yersinia artesiana TaxID=2890315 RepID=UPI0015840C11|nr:hypothetical protein [Yersinia artesiana]
MKTLLMICMSSVLLFNTATSYAAPPVHKGIQTPSDENCKRPPEPPKDKNGRPLPPPKDHNSHTSKGQPPHDGKHACPPPQGSKKP